MSNIILMGPPGGGKTSVGKLLSKELNMPFYDIDDDHLETIWNTSVAAKLAELGDEKFLEAEGEALMQLNKEHTVISLSGSNPLHETSMEHVQKLGTIIYLDAPNSEILKRLELMHVDRIVGQQDKTIAEILAYRGQFYEKWYDERIVIEHRESLESITEKVLIALEKNEKFESTRGYADANLEFLDVVKKGLSPDGGLFVPQKFPSFSLGELRSLLGFSYAERAQRILEKFPLGSLSATELQKMIGEAYSNNFYHEGIVPLSKLNDEQFLLEIFHGPTASFKDAALQLTPKFFSRAIQSDAHKYLILVATSGDTGIAAVEGFKHEKNVSVMVLYPKDGVSAVQKKQMLTASGENVHVLGVDGDFDFCQHTVKQIFRDEKLSEKLETEYNFRLSAANSMNWGRLLPQVVYYISAYLDLVQRKEIILGDPIDICVPTGNSGNILAAMYAQYMGIPVDKFICASNENNILTDFFQTGVYDLRERTLKKTTSPSIDILKSSNLERLLFYLDSWRAHEIKKYFSKLETEGMFEVSHYLKSKLKHWFFADWCSENDCHKTIQKVYAEYNRLIDPHTAVAKFVADKFQGENKMIIASTAHFAKFPGTVLSALGEKCDETNISEMFAHLERIAPHEHIHPKLKHIHEKEILHTETCPAEYEAVVKNMKKFLRTQKVRVLRE